MGKNILIAFNDSQNAMRAVDFVARHFVLESSITLFSVLEDTETMRGMKSPVLTSYFKDKQQTVSSLEDKKHQLTEKGIETARNCLIEAGFKKESVHTKAKKCSERSTGAARDIIQEADSEYNVVVIGKKGMSALQEFFFGSVSQKVLQGVKIASVLAVT